MADDVTLPGVGTTVATDDIGGGRQAQIIKLADGGNGSAVPVGATDQGGGVGALHVEPHQKIEKVVLTPVIDAVAYTAGDIFGTLLQIPNAVKQAGGSGYIQKIVVLDKSAAQRPILDVVMFDQTMTLQANNQPFAPSDADMANCVGVLPVGAYNTPWPGTATNSIATAVLQFPYICAGTTLFVVLVVRNTPTMAIGDVTVAVSYTRN